MLIRWNLPLQVVASLIGSLIIVCGGSNFGWLSATIPILLSDDYPVHYTVEEISYLTVLTPITMMISSLFYPTLTDIFGRKKMLLVTAVPYVLGWICVILSNSLYIFYLSRLIVGFGDGGYMSILYTYIGEITTKELRGICCSMTLVSFYLGIFLTNLIGSYLSIVNTAYCMCTVPILFLICFSFVPESPYYLVMNNKMDEAKRNLIKLRVTKDVDEELKQIQIDINRQLSERGNFKDLFLYSWNRKALFIVVLVRFAQQFSGIGAFIGYNQYFFQQAGGNIDRSTSSIIALGTFLVLIALNNILLHKFGCRLSFLISSFGSTLILLSESTYFFLAFYTDVDLSSVKWFPLFGMIAYAITFSLGLELVPNVYLSEMLSVKIKSNALAVHNVSFGLMILSSMKIFQVLESNFSLFAPMMFYTVCCFISTITAFFTIPDTKGLTLEEIQQMLKGH